MSNDNNSATLSFDRMRSMLVRAAEIRDSEQQQVFDALDEIHARLAPLESLGSVRKRLSELPDRTEVSVLAERLDETLARLEAQDGAIAGLSRAVEAIVDKLAKPFAELGGRLDGVAGRFEGVAGRMDGLEDRIAGLHKRIDDLDHHLDKQDGRIDGLPGAVHGPVRERLESLETGVRGQLGETREELGKAVREGREAVHGLLATTRDELSGALDAQTTQLDPSGRLEGLAERLEQLGERLVAIDGSVANRPDADSLASLVRRANEESETRHAGQLDEAMATFAELTLGGTPPQLSMNPPPPPRPAQRRTRKPAGKSRDTGSENDGEDAPTASS